MEEAGQEGGCKHGAGERSHAGDTRPFGRTRCFQRLKTGRPGHTAGSQPGNEEPPGSCWDRPPHANLQSVALRLGCPARGRRQCRSAEATASSNWDWELPAGGHRATARLPPKGCSGRRPLVFCFCDGSSCLRLCRWHTRLRSLTEGSLWWDDHSSGNSRREKLTSDTCAATEKQRASAAATD